MARRPQGQWHMMLHLASKVAFPLVYSVYLGVAEAARDIAVAYVRKRPADDLLCCLIGEMENELATARLARDHIVAIGATADPSRETTNRIMIGKTISGQAAMRTASKAMDVGGARYHPLQEKAQHRYTGRTVLDLPING